MARKISGGKYKKARKRKKTEYPGLANLIAFGEEKKKKIRIRGGHEKTMLLSTNKVNVFNQKTKKSKVVKIKAVLETPANRFLKKVLIKGAIIDTEAGKARITNRPGQEGFVQAVLVE